MRKKREKVETMLSRHKRQKDKKERKMYQQGEVFREIKFASNAK